MQSGFAFVLSHLKITGDLPVQLMPNHIFRAAKDLEIEEIRTHIRQSVQIDFEHWAPYEIVAKEIRNPNGCTYDIEVLPRDQWKYWVVAFEGNNFPVHNIELVALLLPVNFEFGFHIYYSEPLQQGTVQGRQYMPLHMVDRFRSFEHLYGDAESATSTLIASIGELYRLHEAIPEQYAFVRAALKSFSQLRRVPSSSDLVIVGLFSIIESLITHQPRLNETLDSINHQITNKIMLLRKRYSREIDPPQYFLKAAEENIWKKLYGYRSNVAHGTPISFDVEYKVLKDRECVVRFLRDNIKELLLMALKEPEFLFDLRKC